MPRPAEGRRGQQGRAQSLRVGLLGSDPPHTHTYTHILFCWRLVRMPLLTTGEMTHVHECEHVQVCMCRYLCVCEERLVRGLQPSVGWGGRLARGASIRPAGEWGQLCPAQKWLLTSAPSKPWPPRAPWASHAHRRA